jgi:hypothetical protein
VITDNDKRTGPPVTINDVYYTHIIWLQHTLALRGHHQVIQENKNTQKGDILFCLIMPMFEKCKKSHILHFIPAVLIKTKGIDPVTHTALLSVQSKSLINTKVSQPIR